MEGIGSPAESVMPAVRLVDVPFSIAGAVILEVPGAGRMEVILLSDVFVSAAATNPV